MSVQYTARRYYNNSKRLLFKSTKMPSKRELRITTIITALGVVFIGTIGFLVHQIIAVTLG